NLASRRHRPFGLPDLARGNSAHRWFHRKGLSLHRGRAARLYRPGDRRRSDVGSIGLLLLPRDGLHVHAGAGSRTARAGADQHAGHGAGMGLRGLRTLAGRLPLDFPAPCDAFSAGPKITSHRLALHTGAAMIDIRKKLQDELNAIDYELRI